MVDEANPASTTASVTAETTVTQTGPVASSSWLHTNLRNLVAMALTLLVCWLALSGNEQAQAALIAAFTVLVGVIFGERAALKVPGRDT